MNDAAARPARSLRVIQSEMSYAAQRMLKAATYGLYSSMFLAAVVLATALSNGRWGSSIIPMIVIVLTGASAIYTARSNRIAAVLLVIGFVGAVIATYVTTDVIRILAFLALIWAYAMFDGCRASFEFARLRTEYARTWTPRLIQPGDLFSVRDGHRFAVAKLLALEPGKRVHIKLYAMRYPSRPSIVKSTTLLRPPKRNDAQVYAHLPLDVQEFLRWEPVPMRSEPVRPDELEALEAWRRIAGLGADVSGEPDHAS